MFEGFDTEEANRLWVSQQTASAASVNSTCTDYLHTTHPETGVEVVFVPGEALPEWALAVQQKKNAPAAPDVLPAAHKPLRASAAKADTKGD